MEVQPPSGNSSDELEGTNTGRGRRRKRQKGKRGGEPQRASSNHHTRGRTIRSKDLKHYWRKIGPATRTLVGRGNARVPPSVGFHKGAGEKTTKENGARTGANRPRAEQRNKRSKQAKQTKRKTTKRKHGATSQQWRTTGPGPTLPPFRDLAGSTWGGAQVFQLIQGELIGVGGFATPAVSSMCEVVVTASWAEKSPSFCRGFLPVLAFPFSLGGAIGVVLLGL